MDKCVNTLPAIIKQIEASKAYNIKQQQQALALAWFLQNISLLIHCL